eukprot:6149146-Prymnesium_polylepis.1
MPKAAKVTHPPRRPSICESDPPLKILLPPRDPDGPLGQPDLSVVRGAKLIVSICVPDRPTRPSVRGRGRP